MISLNQAVIGKINYFSKMTISGLFIVLIIYSLISAYLEIGSLTALISDHIRNEISTYDESGELYLLQKQVASTFSVLKKHNESEIAIQVFADANLIADWGKTGSIGTIEFTKSYLSKSSKNIEIKYSIQTIPILLRSFFISIALTLIVLGILFLQKKVLIKHLKLAVDPINQLIDNLRTYKNHLENPAAFKVISFPRERIEEISTLEETLRRLFQSIKDYENQVRSLNIALGERKIAKQVAHDIRSPLSALNIVISTLSEIEIEKKNLLDSAIQRINGIADDLLKKSNVNALEDKKNVSSSKDKFQPDLIIKQTLTEKKVLHPDVDFNLEIRYSNNVFLIGNPMDFSRIISNVINNSIEAESNRKLEIKILIQPISDGETEIIISDNGKGIPKEIQNLIGSEGFSYGKESSNESGSGLGLYNAKVTVNSWGGYFAFHSEMNKGTNIFIRLPNWTPQV